MRIHAMLAAALVLQGCAYTTESAQKMTTQELCITLHDRGSISGIPERNAAQELDARGNPDCSGIMENYWQRVGAMSRAIPETKQPQRMNCNSTVLGNQISTSCY